MLDPDLSKDLLKKYHGDEKLVDALVASKDMWGKGDMTKFEQRNISHVRRKIASSQPTQMCQWLICLSPIFLDIQYHCVAQGLKMYWCWDSTLERSSQKVSQSVELERSTELDAETSGAMMWGS